MEYVENQQNAKITLAIIEAIHENAAYLSEIDGATGDGDHGVNMDKGFMMAKDRIQEDMDLSESLKVLGRTLVMDIGGSMGPIYGRMFSKMAKIFSQNNQINKLTLYQALNCANEGLMDLAGAKPGDKTLIDCLNNVVVDYELVLDEDKPFTECLNVMYESAEAGKENTKNLVAKIGRAARLGERSKGFLDAGATSCCIILKTLASAMSEDVASE